MVVAENAVLKKLNSPRESARYLGVGLTYLFALIKSGRLKAVKLGSLTKISAESLEAFIASLPVREQ